MEALIALLTLVALGALALRFGHDSRDAPHSSEHDLAVRGVTWTHRSREQAGSRTRAAGQPSGAQHPLVDADAESPSSVTGAPSGSRSVSSGTAAPSRDPKPNSYPTLALIDRLREPARPRLTAVANAAVLEDYARELVGEYWGDTVWLTGRVSNAAFRRVVDELDALRIDVVTAVVTVGPRGVAAVDPVGAAPAQTFGSPARQVVPTAPELLSRAS